MSWVRDDGRDGTFVTLADVMAAHGPDEIAGVVAEHGGCLNEVAATIVAHTNEWLRPGTVFEPFDDVALSATIEGLIDFSAELASLVLARADSGQADSTDWAPAVVVLRAVTSLSSAVAALDAVREALQPPD